MCTILCAVSVVAQDATGTISGKVTDGETGDPLVRATVMITVNGKVKGTFADSKGAYALRNVPVGEYDVRFRFLGFQEKVMKRVGLEWRTADGKSVVNKYLTGEEMEASFPVVAAVNGSKSIIAYCVKKGERNYVNYQLVSVAK